MFVRHANPYAAILYFRLCYVDTTEMKKVNYYINSMTPGKFKPSRP